LLNNIFAKNYQNRSMFVGVVASQSSDVISTLFLSMLAVQAAML